MSRHKTKLTVRDIADIKYLLNEGVKVKYIMEDYPVPDSQVRRVWNGDTK